MQNVRRRTRTGDPAQHKPRGRPRAFDRDEALAAATRVFWRKGFTATSMADLTAVMGIGSPSLYAAFGSKEALYGEALRFYEARYASQVWERFKAAPSARDAVSALLMDSAAAFARKGDAGEPPGCMLMLSAAGAEGCVTLGDLVAAGRAAALRQIRDRLARALAEGELPLGAGINGLARYILAVQQGMSIQARDGATRVELEGVARAAMAGWDTLAGP